MFEGNNYGQKSDNNANERHVSIGDAATLLGVSIDTVRRWEKAGKLHAERLDGKNRYFSVRHLEDFNANRPMSSTEVAKLLKVSASTVRRLDNEGKLTARRTEKGKRLYDKAEVMGYINTLNQEMVAQTNSKGIVATVIETMSETASEVDTALKNELQTFKQIEENEAGSLINANIHLPFSSWKVALYLLIISFGVFGTLTNLKMGPNSVGIFSSLNRTGDSNKKIRQATGINMQGLTIGTEPGNLVMLPITSSQIKDGSINGTDLAAGSIQLGHLSTDLQQQLGKASNIVIGSAPGPQGATGPRGVQGPAGPGSGITGITAGSGLSGGGLAGSVSLGLQACSTVGQLLKWTGSSWFCDDDNVSVFPGTWAVANGGTGANSFTTNGLLYGNGTDALQSTSAGISGQIILANASGIPTFTTISGDASLLASGVLSLTSTGVVANTYGSSTQVPVLTVDASGRLTAVSNTTVTGTTPGGPAGGDLSGSYPNPTVVKINGNNLGITTPTTGNLLVANGTDWSSTAVSGDILLNGLGVVTIQSNAVALGGDTVGNYVASIGALTGLVSTDNSGEGATPTLAVSYGSIFNTAVQGNTQITIAAGTGLSGGGAYTLGAGGSQTLSLANTSVSANSYGSATSVATFTVDAQGRLTAAGSTSIAINANQVTTGMLTTARGGTGIDASSATNGQLLIGTGSGLSLGTLIAGNGIAINNGSGTISVSNSIQTSKGLEVNEDGLSLIDCASSEVLKYSGSNQWVCAADVAGGVTDADKGDITVTGSGNSWSIDNGAVSNTKLQNSSISLLYSGNLTGDASVALGSTLNIGFSATPSFTSVNATTFTGNLTGNASTASALAVNPSDCAADTYARTIAANGDLTCAVITDAALSSNVTKLGATIDLATGEVSGNLRASSLQVAAADLGAADVNINLSNSNGSFNTNLIIDGVISAASFIGTLSGNATTATALAVDPSDCAVHTYATALAANGNLSCASITDAALSSNITKLGVTITKDELTNTGVLGFTWSDAEVADTLTIGASSTVADAALSSNVTKLGNSIQNAEVDDDLTISASGSVANGALSASVTLAGNAFNGSSQLVQTTAGGLLPALDGSLITNVNAGLLSGQSGSYYLSLANATGTLSVARIADTSITNAKLQNSAITITAGTGLSGGGVVDLGSSTTVRLANTTVTADDYGSAGSVATFTVDAQGRITAANSTSIAITASQITSGTLAVSRGGTGLDTSSSTGIAVVTGGTWSINAALSDSQVSDTLTIGAGGSVIDGALSSNVTKLGASIQNAEVDDDLTISASGNVADGALSANVTKLGNTIDLASGEVSGSLRAINLQSVAVDLGDADVNINLSNTNGSFNTNLILDGSVTASNFVGSLAGNASTATSLASDPADCAANTFAHSIASSGNLSCSVVSKTSLSSSGILGFAWSDAEISNTLTSSIFIGSGSTTDAVDLATAEISGVLADTNVSDTLTVGASSTVADGALSVNVTKLGFSIQNLEVDDDLTISAGGSVADGALSANVTKLGAFIDLVSEITGNLLATSLQNTAMDLGAANVNINLSNSNGSFNTNLTVDGAITASSFSGNLTGNATTATALAGDPADCAAHTYATTIVASGNLTCAAITDAALSSNITKLGASITKDELTGTGTLGFTWVDSEVADTLTIGASSTVADAALSGNITKLGVSIQNAEVDDDLTISASGSVADGALSATVTKLGSAIDLATSEVSGQLRATNLQNAAADLGAANVDIVLSNTNGAFVTNLTLDGSVTAASFNGALSGNATTATALTTNPVDCGPNTLATTIAANGDLTCSSVSKTALANSGTLAFTWSDAEVNDSLTASILVGVGSSTSAVDLATSEVAGNLRATNLQNAAADLGGTDININLGNTNGTFNTNLTLDGSVTTGGNINTTAGSFQLNGADINTAGTLTNVAYENQANTFTVASSFTAAGTALSVSNNASIGGTISVGGITIGGGTTITGHLSAVVTNLVSASIGPNACDNYGTITVIGAAVGDTVTASPTAIGGGIETVNLSWSAAVTAANTVTIRACQPGGLTGLDTANTQTWRADVWKH